MLLHLENPHALWAIILVIVLGMIMILNILHHRSHSPKKKLFLILTGLIFCILGLCRPQLGHNETKVRTSSSNIVIAIDISQSMLAKDITPSRLHFSRNLSLTTPI